MNIVHVVPISRGVGKETLSYFTVVDVPVGSIVKAPLRNKSIPALVVKSERVDDLKSEIKNASYTIRKIGKTKAIQAFLPEFVEAAEETARYTAGSTGSVLSTLTSKTILEHSGKITPASALVKILSTKDSKPDFGETTADISSLQADEEERLAHYKSLIREQFAKKRSVFFCLPTIQDTKRIFETLTKGIEEYACVLNSSLPPKELVEAWNKAVSEPHPILIIATGAYFSIPRHDIGIIIVERESSTSYKSQVRPFIDVRTFAEFFAKKINARLIFGDLLLRTETLWRTNNGEFAELGPLKFRSISTADISIVDMKKYKTLDSPEFRIIGTEMEALISINKENNENMFIFAARRGLSPTTVCGDCGTTVLCTRCSAPIVLHESRGGNFFLCHRCGERRSAEERCKVCGSWKLTTLGIGIELIEKTIRGMFPDVTIFRLDKDSAKTHKQASRMVQEFYSSPGSILIGTEMTLTYLEKPIENAAVASIDSLFSIPDFRINEKIMNILLRMRSATRRRFVIQTRSRDQELFDYASKGNLMDFYRLEIEGRKKLNYPPFSLLIKITIKGNRDHVMSDMEQVKKDFVDYPIVFFPAFIETINKKTVMHALIKLERNIWPEPLLLQKLLDLPLHIAVNVDPESLL